MFAFLSKLSNLLNFCLDLVQSCINGAPNENQTYSWKLVGLVSLFNGISVFMGYLITKPPLVEVLYN